MPLSKYSCATVAGATPPRAAGDGWTTLEINDKLEAVVEGRTITEPTKTLKRLKSAKRIGSMKTIMPVRDGKLHDEVTSLVRERANDVSIKQEIN